MSIFKTDDGSHSIISNEFGEAYHSRHGAIAESQHVFINAGLIPHLESKDRMAVLEIGLGTGLNALMTAIHTIPQNKPIHYTAYEKYPLSKVAILRLNYIQELKAEKWQSLFNDMHLCPWHDNHELHPQFTIHKIEADFSDLSDSNQYDLIYMDAFAPTAQALYWELPFISQLANALKPGGTIVSYCAKGSFKRALKSAGLEVEGLPGPPGKREMTRARKLNPL